ncbi:MAG: 1,6-anhydro-N-acetylmuramyl-L-alanine amidase AmpD [Pseudomonadales bacterium]|nr:1,6-anhydro-N-acetylmuramyl-L-alanine amidase AmpD [Pseudomonadales bacterium]MCP5345591.1 1,6-anhydro-N-acetylmuramyl-L-alanine amidase AmpD [Pseudomonadales bacterium]
MRDQFLVPSRHLVSPNQSSRPDGVEISLLVIHNISLPPGEFGGGHVDELFCNCLDPERHPYFAEVASLQVSAHLLIDRAGTVTQYVPFDRKAWHAGQSCFQGRDNCNDYSIGIELEGTDELEYSDHQYAVLTAITGLLMNRFPAINLERIVGHSDIAPERKTDPGPGFDWQRYRKTLAG